MLGYASGCCKVRKYHVNMMYNLTSFKARGFIFFTEQLIWKIVVTNGSMT